MRMHVVVRYTGFSLLLNAGFLLLASLVSALYSGQSLVILLYSALISLLFGLFPMVFVPPTEDITDKEGLVIVVLSWLACCRTKSRTSRSGTSPEASMPTRDRAS